MTFTVEEQLAGVVAEAASEPFNAAVAVGPVRRPVAPEPSPARAVVAHDVGVVLMDIGTKPDDAPDQVLGAVDGGRGGRGGTLHFESPNERGPAGYIPFVIRASPWASRAG